MSKARRGRSSNSLVACLPQPGLLAEIVDGDERLRAARIHDLPVITAPRPPPRRSPRPPRSPSPLAGRRRSTYRRSRRAGPWRDERDADARFDRADAGEEEAARRLRLERHAFVARQRRRAGRPRSAGRTRARRAPGDVADLDRAYSRLFRVPAVVPPRSLECAREGSNRSPELDPHARSALAISCACPASRSRSRR